MTQPALALVTGASSGIGKSFAEVLAADTPAATAPTASTSSASHGRSEFERRDRGSSLPRDPG